MLRRLANQDRDSQLLAEEPMRCPRSRGPARSKLKRIPRVMVVSSAARNSDAVPSTDPMRRFFNQPGCGEEPRAEKGSSSSNAPQPQPTISDEKSIAPWPDTTDQRLLLT